jgi:hypothetical protein
MNDAGFLQLVRRYLEVDFPGVQEEMTDDQLIEIRESLIQRGYLLRSGNRLLITPKGRHRFIELGIRLAGEEN